MKSLHIAPYVGEFITKAEVARFRREEESERGFQAAVSFLELHDHPMNTNLVALSAFTSLRDFKPMTPLSQQKDSVNCQRESGTKIWGYVLPEPRVIKISIVNNDLAISAILPAITSFLTNDQQFQLQSFGGSPVQFRNDSSHLLTVNSEQDVLLFDSTAALDLFKKKVIAGGKEELLARFRNVGLAPHGTIFHHRTIHTGSYNEQALKLMSLFPGARKLYIGIPDGSSVFPALKHQHPDQGYSKSNTNSLLKRLKEEGWPAFPKFKVEEFLPEVTMVKMEEIRKMFDKEHSSTRVKEMVYWRGDEPEGGAPEGERFGSLARACFEPRGYMASPSGYWMTTQKGPYMICSNSITGRERHRAFPDRQVVHCLGCQRLLQLHIRFRDEKTEDAEEELIAKVKLPFTAYWKKVEEQEVKSLAQEGLEESDLAAKTAELRQRMKSSRREWDAIQQKGLEKVQAFAIKARAYMVVEYQRRFDEAPDEEEEEVVEEEVPELDEVEQAMKDWIL